MLAKDEMKEVGLKFAERMDWYIENLPHETREQKRDAHLALLSEVGFDSDGFTLLTNGLIEFYMYCPSDLIRAISPDTVGAI